MCFLPHISPLPSPPESSKRHIIFKCLKDASVYAQTIETFWKAVDEANKCAKAMKDSCYQEILTLMGNQVSAYGKGCLSHDLKKAVNEIEEHLNIEMTIWQTRD